MNRVCSLPSCARLRHTCDAIAALTGLSRTGVFDICKHHAASGPSMLHDTVGGHKPGQHRLLKHLSKQGHAQGVPAVGSAS